MLKERAARAYVGLLACLWLAAAGASHAGEPVVVGRVRITPAASPALERARTVERLLTSRSAGSAAGAFPSRVLVAVGPDPRSPDRFRATLYDYALEQGFEVLLDAAGTELAREPLKDQPPLAREELDRAQATVGRDPRWADGIASGALRLYAPMPPVSTDVAGRRLINVGILGLGAPSGESSPARSHEVVSVHIPSGDVERHAGGAPATSAATLQTCGLPAQTSCTSIASCGGAYLIEWPAAAPIWRFKVRHPYCTRSVQPDATGLELTDVYFENKLVLTRAELPVLNVKYVGDICGPYRDWLWEEDCFQATGTDVAPGIRVTAAGSPPKSYCESTTDQGNFKGVAIHDEGASLWLVTETKAGWYRYVMQWRLHADGVIEPIFGFGGVENSCTCVAHLHHAYWRFLFALDGVPGDPATGVAALGRRAPGTPDLYEPITAEGRFHRPTSQPETDWWRIENPRTGTAWILRPGAGDGSALGDDFAIGDAWALADNPGEINDSNLDKRIRLDPWVDGEPIGASKRLALWHRAGYGHDESAGHGEEQCGFAGPTLAPAALDRDDDGRTIGEGDCDDQNAGVWWTPEEVTGLTLSQDAVAGVTRLDWPAPTGGGTAFVYDVIRSPDAADFSAAGACLESDDGTDTAAGDAASPGPGGISFYLVRAENACPSGLGRGSLGADSAGRERAGRDCP